jgi:hypothetical protein
VGSEVQILPGPPPSTPLGVDRNARLSGVSLVFLLSCLFFFLTSLVHRLRWGCSSAGRAPALQAGGHRFEPVHLHQTRLSLVQNLTLPRFCLSSFLVCFLSSMRASMLRGFVGSADRRREVVPFDAGLSCHSQRRAGDPASLMPRDSGRVFFKL